MGGEDLVVAVAYIGAGLDKDPLSRLVGILHGDGELQIVLHPEYRLMEDCGRQPAKASGLGKLVEGGHGGLESIRLHPCLGVLLLIRSGVEVFRMSPTRLGRSLLAQPAGKK